MKANKFSFDPLSASEYLTKYTPCNRKTKKMYLREFIFFLSEYAAKRADEEDECTHCFT